MAKPRRRSLQRSKSRLGKRASKRPVWLRWLLKLWWSWTLLPLLLLTITVVYLDAVVRHKFEGKKWALPARVYAQPLELYAGLPLKRQALAGELRALGYQFSGGVNKPGRALQNGATLSAHTRGFAFWDKQEPALAFQATFADDVITDLTDLQGEPLAIVRLEPQEIGGIYPAHMEDRLLVRLQDIPPLLGEALIAVEDRHFLVHQGISLRGITRAMLANVKAGGMVQGGSTLTQQLVKNFYLDQSRTLSRKVIEAIMSLSLDFHYSKSEILETYLNEVYLGQSGERGIHGFALASQHYFRQPLVELKTHQIALLVGLVKGASFYNPWRQAPRATERRDLVLKVMFDSELITDFEYQLAKQQPLDVVDTSPGSLYSYPAFIDLVKRQLRRDYQEEDLRSEGLRVFTTLAPHVQQQAQAALTQQLLGLENAYQLAEQTLQGAVVVTEVGSGEVLAVVGDRKAAGGGFNRALDAQRAIGSLIKPAVYLTALSQPEKYTLVTKVDDSEVSVFNEGGNVWRPQNFSRESHGEVPLYWALAESYNQATTRLGINLEVPAVLDTLEKLGLERSVQPVPSVLLGAVDLSPLVVSELYQTIATEGVRTPLRAIRSVMTAEGQPLSRYPLNSENRIAPEYMHLIQFALVTAMREGTGKTAYEILPRALQVAGKTGTTNDQRDSWFAGYSADHLAVVWVGRDDNGPTPLTGATGALRVWSTLFAQIATRSLQPLAPEGVHYYWVDPQTGNLSAERCADAKAIPFVTGSEPRITAKCERAKPWFL